MYQKDPIHEIIAKVDWVHKLSLLDDPKSFEHAEYDDMGYVISLDLGNTKIEKLEEGIFDKLFQLENLIIDNNQISQ